MTIIESLILGAIQGLTEFLPISSSGHLVLFQNLFGIEGKMLAYDIIVHFGTLMAVIAYFAKDFMQMIWQSFFCLYDLIRGKNKNHLFELYPKGFLSGYIIIATIPTVMIGFIFKDVFEYFFQSTLGVSIAWAITGTILLLSKKFQNGKRSLKTFNQKDAFLIGTLQGVAILPGISRSGMTIAAGMYSGFDRKAAARFSFLLSLPAIVGAGVFKFKDGIEVAGVSVQALLVGFVSATLVGYLSILFLMKITEKGQFYFFGFYCLILSAVTLVYSLLT